MGQLSSQRLVALVVCFCLTSLLIYSRPATLKREQKHASLSNALSEIPGWRVIGKAPLEKKFVTALKLDDYINRTYSDGKAIVSLYIGYYLSYEKVGAAHDPLVCFPGQGWNLGNVSQGKIMVGYSEKHTITYSTMTVQKDQDKELIIYWFQSYDKTNPGTFSQKIFLLWAKVLGKGADNAFVRISIPVGKKSLSECHETIFKFIKSFYPAFLEYVKS